jgi:hypothetical protein
MAQLNVTELDFDNIKENLKTYFKNSDSPFKDWDYEGSGLNTILDVLAYNTHYNAVLAHMSVNESFLDTAQVRSNVVSSAKLLGYLPYSMTSPYVYVDVSFIASKSAGLSVPNKIILPKGTKFKTILDGVNYQYVTSETYTASLSTYSNTYDFTNVKLLQGSFSTARFSVDNSNTNQKYIISDSNIDINTLVVRVYSNQTVSESEIYTRFTSFNDITGDSKIYFLNENAFGNYEITFGDNIFGKMPNTLSMVELEYLVTQGGDSNGCYTFKFADSVLEYTTGNPTVVASNPDSAKAVGGSEKESLDSIRKNAPLSLIAQNRAVTADDYKAIIRQDFKAVDSISVWGGEYNDPPQYGSVFISVKPSDTTLDSTDNLFLTSDQENEILGILENKRVLTISPVLVKPDYTYLYFNIFFKYDPNITALSTQNLEYSVNTAIKTFEKDQLLAFDNIFRHSKFLNAIDNSNIAILNSSANVFAYKNIDISNIDFQSMISFSFQLSGEFNRMTPFMSSSSFQLEGTTCFISDEYTIASDTERNLFVYTLNSSGQQIRIKDSVGTLNPTLGVLKFSTLRADTATTISIFVNPASNDIPVVRNQILLIDSRITTITGDIDEIISGGSGASISYSTLNRDI